jgi:hypothetical protein
MRTFCVVSIAFALLSGSIASQTSAWDGPLFGLATAPDGDVLVADTGAGVVNDDTGALMQSIPGVTDIAPIGKGSWWVTRTGAGVGDTDSGQALLRASKGKVRVIANLFQFEQANNPHPATLQSNPFDVHALGGDTAIVADAAGNDLLRVDDEGDVHVLAIFPTRLASLVSLKAALGCPAALPPCGLPDMFPAEAVPTSIAVGPDGYYYVGELRGFPGPLNQSRIWRVAPWAHWADCGVSPDCTVAFDGGFTSIIDLAWGPDGLLYVVEFDENAWFAAEVLGIKAGGTVSACDVDSLTCVEVATGISYITAITFGKRGELYATQDAIIPPLASVIEIQ